MTLTNVRGMRRRLRESDTYRVADSGADPMPRRWWQRQDRNGLASNELVILMIVLAALALAGTVGFLIVRAVRSGSEHSVVQQNIDQISGLADTYWDQFAADVDGRRKINLAGFCNYVNNNVTDDVNVRTLQYVDSALALEGAPTAGANGLFRGIASVAPTSNEANCHATRSVLDEKHADIVATDTLATAAITAAANLVRQGATPVASDLLAVAKPSGQTDAAQADEMRTALEAVDLLSTRTVWIAQFGDTNSDFGTSGTGGFAPTGADIRIDEGGSTATDVGAEFIVIGGVAPDGTSFCLLKVFDATDAGHIGDYRVSRAPQDDLSFASCSAGWDQSDNVNEPRKGGGWPEAEG